MNNLLAQTILDDSLQGIVTKLQSLMGQLLDLHRYALAAVSSFGAHTSVSKSQSHIRTKRKSMPAIWSRTLSSVSLSSSS